MISISLHAPSRRAPPAALIFAASAAFLSFAHPGMADEGMWTFDHPPTQKLESAHNFRLTAQWLEHLSRSALWVSGASGSFVSAQGLVLTNHHVVLSCVQKLSSATRDLAHEGYIARTGAEELPCPGFEVKRLESMQDVTARVQGAIHAADPATANAERNAIIASIENQCAAETRLRCEIETRYGGAVYQLLRYKAWNDVRLVFAPESRLGFFGGDPDNFVYPRFDLDAALLRVYEGGKPSEPEHFLRWSPEGVRDGDLVFAAGHPYATDRLVTVAQLEQQRDVGLPLHIASAQRQRRDLKAFAAKSGEAARRANENLFGTENWLKAMLGEYKALRDPALFEARRSGEATLRKAWSGSARADPWARVESASRLEAMLAKEMWAVSYGYNTLLHTAGRIVELAYERALPDDARLADYRESSIPRLLTRVNAEVPIYKDLEVMRLAGYWREAMDLLGPEHPFVKEVLAASSPETAAARVVEPSKLDDVAVRRGLIDGGIAAVEASADPLIALARRIYPMRRRLAKRQEIEIDEPIRQASDDFGQLRLKALGTDAYPDATGALRLSYGVVRGYDADGAATPWQTNFWGLFARNAAFDNKPPFDLPQRWLELRRDIASATPLDFVSTLDIIGGNSGSPVVNRRGELVGLVFDGNLESLGARFAYTEDKARAISVDTRALSEALRSVYRAPELLRELRGE
ncbi:MAG: S46 family peptidase [Pseudomonadota bacterium]|nr:S46 family peptidase [Pseudomonadota bacterium]